jgi:putative intracellular protease/amidase
MSDLSNKKITIVVDNYFEEAELAEPLKALKAAGAHMWKSSRPSRMVDRYNL